MGGDYGGSDCVHVIDVGAVERNQGRPMTLVGITIRPDTDVLIHDEHGNVCQFTYAEFDAFRYKMRHGAYDGIGDVPAPEDSAPMPQSEARARAAGFERAITETDQRIAPPIPGEYGCATCESDDGCAECRAPNDPDPFDQPPGRPALPRRFVNEPLAEIDAWDRRYGS